MFAALLLISLTGVALFAADGLADEARARRLARQRAVAGLTAPPRLRPAPTSSRARHEPPCPTSDPRTTRPTPSHALLDELPDLDWITDAGRVARLSQDFAWFSPVLNRQLKDKRADAVARPRTEDEIRALVGACARHARADHDPRQRHRQLRPDHAAGRRRGARHERLQRACAGCARGVARAQAGIRLGELEKQARATRPGAALPALDLPQRHARRPVRRRLRRRRLDQLRPAGRAGQRAGRARHDHRGRAAGRRAARRRGDAHAPPVGHQRPGAGAGGRPGAGACRGWRRWSPSTTSTPALAFADALARAPGLVKREVAFFASPVPDHLAQLAEHLPAGCHAVLSLVAEPARTAMRDAGRRARRHASATARPPTRCARATAR